MVYGWLHGVNSWRIPQTKNGVTIQFFLLSKTMVPADGCFRAAKEKNIPLVSHLLRQKLVLQEATALDASEHPGKDA